MDEQAWQSQVDPILSSNAPLSSQSHQSLDASRPRPSGVKTVAATETLSLSVTNLGEKVAYLLARLGKGIRLRVEVDQVDGDATAAATLFDVRVCHAFVAQEILQLLPHAVDRVIVADKHRDLAIGEMHLGHGDGCAVVLYRVAVLG